MGTFVYHIIVIGFAALAIFRGYKLGLVRQTSAILGMAFGAICARIFGPMCVDYFMSLQPDFMRGFNSPFIFATLSAGVIYTVVYTIVKLLTGIIDFAVRVLSSGLLNSIFGSLFCLLKYLVFISIVYNLIVDINPESKLLKVARDHDGNVIEGVMLVAPAILGFPDAEELGYQMQLEHAKQIS